MSKLIKTYALFEGRIVAYCHGRFFTSEQALDEANRIRELRDREVEPLTLGTISSFDDIELIRSDGDTSHWRIWIEHTEMTNDGPK